MRKRRILRAVSWLTAAVMTATSFCGTVFAAEKSVTESTDINIGLMKGWGWIDKDKNSDGTYKTANLPNITVNESASVEQLASSQVPNRNDGAWNGAYLLSSRDGGLVGEVNGRAEDIFYMRWAGIDIDPSADTVIFYAELPEYSKSGADWALGINGLGVAQGSNDYWGNLNAANRFSYLATDSDNWVSAEMKQVGVDRQAFSGLPSGFKGYIRIDFNDFAFWSEYDLNSAYKFQYINFIFNSIGGDCGDMLLGGIFYVPSNKSNGIVMQVGSNTYRMSNAPVAVSAVTRWYHGNCDISDTLVRRVDKTVKTAGCACAYDWQGTHIIESKTGETVSGTYSPKWVHAPIDKAVGEIMFYVELPDYEKSGADWGLGIKGFSIAPTASPDDVHWANMTAGVKFAYLSHDGNKWIDSVIGTDENNVLPLPSGFKGYIRLNCGEAEYWNYKYDSGTAYQLETVDFLINSVGVQGGNLLFGAMFYTLTNNTNGVLMKLDGKGFKLTDMPYDLDDDGIVDAADLALLRKAILNTADSYNKLAADANNDGTVDLLDLIRVKKYLVYKERTIMLDKSFKAATSEQDILMLENPDRGWRLEAYISVSGDGAGANEDVWFNVDNNLKKLAVAEASDGYMLTNPKLVQAYFYLDSYCESEKIDQKGLDRIQLVFDKAKELGVKLVVRFAYQGTMNNPKGEASDEIMLSHMKQLKPILEKNKTLINVVEAGFLGAWGEWHSYTMQHDKQKLLTAIIDMVPDELYVQIRYPEIKDVLKNPDGTYIDGITEEIYKRIGIHNDSFFGWSERVVSGAWPMNPPDAEDVDGVRQKSDNQWSIGAETGAYAPIGGETFWGYEIQNSFPTGMTTIDGFSALRQFSLFRQNVFSIMHCYYASLENEYNDRFVYPIMQWRSQKVTEKWLGENGITYSPSYFTDKDGNKIERSVFEFVRDHFGYRLELRNVKVNGIAWQGKEADVELQLANYGFSAAFNIKSGFAILDESGKPVSRVEAGDPSTWNSRNPDDYSDSELLIHNVKAKIKMPEKKGKYKLAFYAENSAGEKVNFANSNVKYLNGYAVICYFEI